MQTHSVGQVQILTTKKSLFKVLLTQVSVELALQKRLNAASSCP